VVGCLRSPYRLVAFDLDGTLVKQVSGWKTLHQYFGTEMAVGVNLADYERGEIDYAEFMRRDIALWPKPLHITTIERALADYTLAGGAAGVVGDLRERGFEVAIVSGGIDLLANRVAERLAIRLTAANGFVIDGDGYLTGEGILRVDPINKHLALERLAQGMGLTLNDCVAVGDGKFDENFLRCAGLGVALGSDVKLRRAAQAAIPNLEELLRLL